MASYAKDKKTGKLVLKSQIETPYQPDQVALPAEPAPAPADPVENKESGK